MKTNATASNSHDNPVQIVTQRQHERGQYAKVFDQRKRRVRGLWERNGSYYAQMTLADEGTGRKAVRRVRLEDADGKPVQTVAEAIKRMNALKVKREEKALALTPKRAPTFNDYADQYFRYFEQVKDAKRASTLYQRSFVKPLQKLACLRVTKRSAWARLSSPIAAWKSGRCWWWGLG